MLCVDLSNNNAAPDFRSLKAHGVEGVWFKVTEGASFVDNTYRARRAAAVAAGLRVGMYHFARPDSSAAVIQAAAFAGHAGAIGRRDLRPVLDYEVPRTAGKDAEWIHEFNHHVKTVMGVGPLFYSNPAVIGKLGLANPVGYGLWLAAYGPDDGQPHPVTAPAPWKSVAAHQYTSKGAVGTYSPVDKTAVLSKSVVLAHPVLGWL